MYMNFLFLPPLLLSGELHWVSLILVGFAPGQEGSLCSIPLFGLNLAPAVEVGSRFQTIVCSPGGTSTGSGETVHVGCGFSVEVKVTLTVMAMGVGMIFSLLGNGRNATLEEAVTEAAARALGFGALQLGQRWANHNSPAGEKTRRAAPGRRQGGAGARAALDPTGADPTGAAVRRVPAVRRGKRRRIARRVSWVFS